MKLSEPLSAVIVAAVTAIFGFLSVLYARSQAHSDKESTTTSNGSGYEVPDYLSRSDEAMLRGWEMLVRRFEDNVRTLQSENDKLRSLYDRANAQHDADRETIHELRLKLDDAERERDVTRLDLVSLKQQVGILTQAMKRGETNDK